MSTTDFERLAADRLAAAARHRASAVTLADSDPAGALTLQIMAARAALVAALAARGVSVSPGDGDAGLVTATRRAGDPDLPWVTGEFQDLVRETAERETNDPTWTPDPGALAHAAAVADRAIQAARGVPAAG